MDEVHHNLAPDILSGRVVEVNSIKFSNAVGLISKHSSSEMRRITDLSRPRGHSVNESVPDRHFKFQTLECAMAMMDQNSYMAILDIRHAYRNIVIRPSDWDLQSFTIGTRNFQDRCLSFGLKIAPEVFTRFTQAVLRIMHRLGHPKIMAYLDEFFMTGTLSQVWNTFCTLIHVLQNLGFYIHWGKAILPSPVVRFLGFLLDAQQMTVSVPPDKMSEAILLINQALSSVWLPVKMWRRLTGKLNHIAKAIYGGRTFLRRIWDLVVMLLKHNRKEAKVSRSAASDLHWWLLFMEQWNGKALILSGQEISYSLSTHASDPAVGAIFHN